MRFLSVILLACIIFMSSLKGILPAAQPKVMDCCKEMTGKACFQHHHDAGKDKHSNGCNQTGCDMLFSCSICGFIVKESLTIPTVKAFQLPKPVAHYISGDLTSYNADNWRPPRAC